MKQIGRDKIMEVLLPRAEKNIEETDLKEGEPMLSEDFSLESIVNWFKLKFNLAPPLLEQPAGEVMIPDGDFYLPGSISGRVFATSAADGVEPRSSPPAAPSPPRPPPSC